MYLYLFQKTGEFAIYGVKGFRIFFPVKPPGVLRGVIEDLELLLAIRQARYQHGLPDEERIARLKEQMEKGGWYSLSPRKAL